MNEIKDRILGILEKEKKAISVSEITRRINSIAKNQEEKTTQPTVSKWVEVLKAENKLTYIDYGNIKLVKIR